MKQLFLAILMVGFFFSSFATEEIPPKLKKKIVKELNKYGLEGTVELKEFDTTDFEISNFENRTLYFLYVDGIDQGLICLTSALGRYEYFDYWVWFGKEGEIKLVRVYKYRSDYGGEITARSWLKQFQDKTPGSLTVGSNVDAISGATISSNSMVDNLNSFKDLLDEIMK